MSKKTAKKTTSPTVKKEKNLVDNSSEKNLANNSNKEKNKNSHFYVVYVDTYIDDFEILPRGVYKTNEKIDRLENSSPQYVAKFKKRIPENILHDIAKTLKISITDSKGDYRKGEEILEEVAQEL